MNRRTVAAFIVLALTTSIGLLPAARAQTAGGATPPEVKKTVDAFLGSWSVTGTDKEPGSEEPVGFIISIDCARAALGAAVSCRFAGELPGVGPIEASSVIGYSPDEKVVRWMEISSTGEYHDHRGRWKGDEIDFEPLTFSIGGAKATERLTVGFPSPGKLTLKAVTETSDGASTMECTGKRLAPKAK